MDILIKDKKSGKVVKIHAHTLDFELYTKSDKSKYDWVTLHKYYNTLPGAVYGALDFILKDPGDDEDKVCVYAEKVRVTLGQVLRERVNEIVAEVQKDV